MHGAGTKTAITTARSFPALLDVTRLTSRVGRGPHTGVDRVELAYLEWCLSTQPQLWGMAKVSNGYVILDRAGLQAFYERLIGDTPWGKRDARAVVGIKTSARRGAAESDLRRLARDRFSEAQLLKNLDRFGALGCIYLNIGHSNISHRLTVAMEAAGIRVAIFLHDLIPLEFPEFQREKTVQDFEAKMNVAVSFASFVLTNSQDTCQKIAARTEQLGGQNRAIYAHLGVTVPRLKKPKTSEVRPYFVALGTIEPRKNHSLLLDVWEELCSELPLDDAPDLHIIGQRGWVDQNVITRLDALKSHPRIHEHNDMADADLWPMVQGAHGLLFPSFAEGFGLPSLEAATLGVPVICGDLAIHRELLGDYPVYADLQDRYLWKKTIIEQAGTRLDDLRKACAKNMPHIPTWDEHFDRINAAVMGSE